MRQLFVLLLAIAPGCTPGLPESVADPEARAKLQERAEELTHLEQALEAADPKIREACEFRAGDCLMELRDKRRELVRGRTFLECEAEGYAEKKARCEEEKLLERGEADSIEAFYDYQIWCLSGMNECIADQVEQAKLDAHRAMVEKRRAAFFGTELARDLETEVRVAEEQLAYARTTLPPIADTVCQDLRTVATCQQRSVDAVTELEEYLALPAAEYGAERAEELLKQAKATDIECVQVERKCVEAELEQHGATTATRALMQQNYELVERRQRLRERIDPGKAEACIREGQTEHAPYILENYRQYARQRIEYFRVQMHRAFARVHRAQIQCLERAGGK
jgi:hypothetical protein